MSFFHVHPDDVRWLRRWLRGNLICMLVCGCLLMMLRMETSVRPSSIRVAADVTATHPAIIPQGWRRTQDGWEHTTTWRTRIWPRAVDLDESPAQPWWIQGTLAMLRAVPPLVFAIVQIALIAIIVAAASRLKRRSVGP